ncbi:conserved hypothetical protein [Formosa agariphila KMM 3901]|uniref:Threonine synthase n=1 Tax=Formosa agariphila (strain DSM 15362 / KCTC 12365 / LMG 23005 / KMM 3901 / M-2Alg 35-1) TaxID=1347342 RepID=T2KLG7_FORAG|nr:DUF6503 family protein [Formosa agariphila]CDF79747.1 conserved hypothetical protein [Formosa agariphila KMM 3901]
MKNILLLLFIVAFASCKQSTEKKTTEQATLEEVVTQDTASKNYPENIAKVFEAHGGLEAWNAMQTLAFTMQKPDGAEVTTTELKSRKAHIEMPNHVLGYNGKDVWLESKYTTAYKGKPKFYYNLMFYFYAMPFVLADDGITYSDAEPLRFEGVEYPGIKISYGAEVGSSPDDEYIIYYDAKTNEMTWLAYTMTFFAKEKSKTFSYIKYGDWQDVNGVKLPKAIQWYNVVDGKPVDVKKEVEFSDVNISEDKKDASFYDVSEGAETIE